MNLSKPYLEDIFNKQLRLKVPVFQRHYVWKQEEQWQPLWDDFINKVQERLGKKNDHAHYTGSIVVYKENTSTSSIPVFDVIDGQQRLTTFQLFLTAFREVCNEKINEESLTNDLNKLLFNDKVYGDTDYENHKFKLEPTKFNKEDFKFIVSHSIEEVEAKFVAPVLRESGIGPKTYRDVAKGRSKILGAYLYFYEQLVDFIDNSEIPVEQLIPLCLSVIKRSFQFVEIGLEATDDPQMIFETMNGRGAALTQTDLIRNFVFMRATKETDSLDGIYDKYWDEYDNPEGKYKWHEKVARGRYYNNSLQFFVIDYLTIKLLTDVRNDQVFYHYKDYIVNKAKYETVEDELKDLYGYSQIYKRLTHPEGAGNFASLARRLNDMDIRTMYPLVMFIEGDNDIPVEKKDLYYSILDSFLVRRFLCGLTTKNYNNLFVDFLKFISGNKDFDAFRELLLSKDGDSTKWPADILLKDRIIERPLYREEKNKSRAIANILLEIEHVSRKSKQEKIQFLNTNLHVEHVLPQNWIEHWPLDGSYISEEEFEKARHAVMLEADTTSIYHQIENRNAVLHSFGNLTILTDALNPSVSNSAFSVKQPAINEESTLKINSYFQKVKDWNEVEIRTRGTEIFESIKNIWKYG